MKIFAQFARFIVGVLFIFSGLIKLNDPVGTQIKLEEYFEVFATDLPALHDLFVALIPYALYLSVFLCTAEVVLGVALLVRYKPKATSWLLLAIILFFTFLTFYSAYFNKVTDCGCFGDAIKLKPWTSFGKDVFLLVLIIFIIYRRRDFRSLPTGMVVAVATVLSLGIAFYAIRHLPILDLLPYRVGANIPQQMQPSEPIRYQYVFEKDGKTQKYEQYPSDTTLVFKEMVVLNEDAKPKITDYRAWNDEGDFTQESFQGKKLILIIKNLKDLNTAAFPAIRKLVDELKTQGVEPLIFTSVSSTQIEQLRREQQLNIPYYYADATVLKTISRSNPGLWLLQEGSVRGKWHYNDTPTAEEVLTLLQR
ncbi:DoxX family protein [Rhabdobacter roseus]|uniref:Putative membrane protein YphA (DoxX/SURF4 family) n=1 Tax=Rhabdobacter roseus TaxID=1655419 RepID=A0A840TQK8_9BACT|nr:BT_3928 family protein [Rhabdobacter roseus]MBB5283523.1 putative membrane protein YphA (DoxX/SURF4 family) [Rhabdobacter roseus]